MNSSVGFDTPPLRVLHLTASVGPKSGGLGPVAIGFAKEQCLLGHSSSIWTLDTATDRENTIQLERMNSAILKTYSRFGPHQFGYSPQMEQAVVSSGAVYDVLHQHSIWLAISRVTSRWRSAFQRPTIIAPHGTLEEFTLKISSWKKKLALLAYEMNNLKGATCLHATSDREALSFRRFGLKNPVAVIPNGISKDWLRSEGYGALFRNRLSIPSDKRLLFFLSRLHPKKGLPLLLDAIAQLRASLTEWLVVIAGFEDPPGYQLELEQMAVKLGITDKIVFSGGLFGQEKRDAFAAADLFVLPTHSDNFAIVIAEALAAGVPVVTTYGAPWEELQTHRCGWWVDVNVDAIREAIQDAIHRPQQELKEMGQRGRVLVEQQYTWKSVAEQTVQLYDWLLGQGQQPSFVIKE